MKIKGIVKSIVFESIDSLYKVLSVSQDDDTISVVGYFPQIDLEGYYEFEGDSIIHPKYGFQFQAKSYVSLNHTTIDGVISYLSSPKFRGIGEVSAKKIVDTLGLDAIEKIKKDENCLTSIKGISKAKAHDIYLAIKENEVAEAIYIKLYSYNLTPYMANVIYSKYLDLTIEKIEENPYILIYDLRGYGFKRCDDLALKIGFKENNPLRIQEAILYSINDRIERSGDTFLTLDQVLNLTVSLLNSRSKEYKFSEEDINLYIDELVMDERIKKVENRIYPIYLYNAETNVANKILDLLNYKYDKPNTNKLNDLIKKVSEVLKIELTDEQKNAIKVSAQNKISIITGGPGTGKTTIMKALLYVLSGLQNVDIFDSIFSNQVLLLAPTGRASKRLMMQTNMNAQTIHRALEYNEFGGFNKDGTNKLSQTIIIIDESSMIDIQLLSHLLDAILINSKIIFVGDSDQLPSVGAGNVLEDLINSKLIPISRLSQILRQKSDSDIIKLSQMVNNKNIDYNIFKNKKEAFFYPQEEINVVPLIIKILEKYLETKGDIFYDMQILAPMYSSRCGIDELNRIIQERFNKSEKFIKAGEHIFKENDKVLQLVNNPELKIMNGDVGIIKMIQKTDDGTFLYIDFDNNIVKYPLANISDLTLGYAISIHKAQGSEYKNVILPIVSSFRIMLKKKLIYTAITRAKEKIIIIGDYKALNNALYQDLDIRQTSLTRLINPSLYKKEESLSKSLENNKDISYIKINDSLSAFEYIREDLNGLTPFDFLDNGGNTND